MRVIMTVDEARRFVQRQLMREHDETIEVDIDVPAVDAPAIDRHSEVECLMRICSNLRDTGGMSQCKIACIKLLRMLDPEVSLGQAKWAVEADYKTAMDHYIKYKTFKSVV